MTRTEKLRLAGECPKVHYVPGSRAPCNGRQLLNGNMTKTGKAWASCVHADI